MHLHAMSRREFGLTAIAAGVAAAGQTCAAVHRDADSTFRLNYIVASCMYGKLPLAELLPEVHACGAEFLEIWAEPHGNQREQLDELGEDAFTALLTEHDVRLGSFTCFGTASSTCSRRWALVKRLGGDMVICNSGGPKDPRGRTRCRSAVLRRTTETTRRVRGGDRHHHRRREPQRRAHLPPDSIRLLMRLLPSERLGIALAPYHLPQETGVIAELIRDPGPRLVHFQAWEHGMGCMTKLPKEQELLQLPHRGPLDWTPLLAALRDIDFAGRVEVFMHPTPRGIPILDTPAQVTAEINRARDYLEARLAVA